MDHIRQVLNAIKNPNTGNTFESEARVENIEVKSGQLHITYKRDGITPQQKRQIEDILIHELKSHYSEDNIFIKTVSSGGSDIVPEQAKPEQKPQPKANLAVGHGQAMPKKKNIPGVKHIIAVSSGKGGVGKSTVATNLSMALKNAGKKVGLLDADIYGPSVPMLLGKRDAKPLSTDDKKIAPIEAHGLKFISFGLFISENDPVIWRGPMLGGVLNQFLFDVAWGELDYLIIDLPPGTGDVQLSMVQAIEISGVVGISTPQDVAMLDSKKGFKMFSQVNVPIIGLIENMSYFTPDDMPDKKYHIFGNGKVKDVAKEIETNFLGEIPMEIALRESCDEGKPYMSNLEYKGRPVWNAYTSIAKKLIDLTAGEKKGFFSKILGK